LLVLGFWPQGMTYVSGQWADMLSALAVTGM
jgi:hypothetical protein